MQPVILVIDDEPTNRDILSRHLKRWGYLVHTAPGGTEGLAFLEGNRVDLVLLDLLMPGMDGYQVLGELKRRPRLRTVPVLMLTAVRDSQSLVKALEIGAVDYVTKPFQELELKARVRAQVRGRELFLHQARSDKILSLGRLTMGFLGELQKAMATVEEQGRRLQSQDLSLDAQCAVVDRIRQELARLPAIVNHLTDFALSSVEGQAPVDWEALVDRVAALGTMGWRARGLVLEWRVEPRLPLVLAPLNQLTQVVVGILENAARVSPSPSVVTLEVRVKNGAVVIDITDQGPGIAPSLAEKIFEPFQSTDLAAGLSLSICRHIVEENQGSLVVVERPLPGALFRITLPGRSLEAERGTLRPEREICGSTKADAESAAVPDFLGEDSDDGP